jgi:hypothetical protein
MRLGFHSSRTDDGADLNEQKFSTSVFEVEIFSTPDDAAVSQRLPDIVIYLSSKKLRLETVTACDETLEGIA